MSERVEHIHTSSEPFKIKLERGQKGGYGWEITVSGSEMAHILGVIAATDEELREDYLTETA